MTIFLQVRLFFEDSTVFFRWGKGIPYKKAGMEVELEEKLSV